MSDVHVEHIDWVLNNVFNNGGCVVVGHYLATLDVHGRHIEWILSEIVKVK